MLSREPFPNRTPRVTTNFSVEQGKEIKVPKQFRLGQIVPSPEQQTINEDVKDGTI